MSNCTTGHEDLPQIIYDFLDLLVRFDEPTLAEYAKLVVNVVVSQNWFLRLQRVGQMGGGLTQSHVLIFHGKDVKPLLMSLPFSLIGLEESFPRLEKATK